jgi:methionyl-tRNA formyltransferase
MKLQVIFWGSSELSIPFLDLLYKNAETEITAVITQPPKPKGRGLIVKPTIVESFAKNLGLKIFSPQDVNSQDFIKILKTQNPVLSIVVSFGKIFSKEIIELHKIGMLNIHFSLLPKYRGCAPIEWTLINGENFSGVTIFWIEEKMDTGKIFFQEKLVVEKNDNYYTLSQKLVELGCAMLHTTLKKISNNKITKYAQVGEPTYAPKITKDMGIIPWQKDAKEIHNLVRGLVHWPKTVSKLKLKNEVIVLKILETNVVEQRCEITNDFGSVVKVKKESLVVQCGNGSMLEILKLQPENKKVMTVKEFLCGHKVVEGDKFFN